MKKCPISRATIIHFETFVLYQNVSYKMTINTNFDAFATPIYEMHPLPTLQPLSITDIKCT